MNLRPNRYEQFVLPLNYKLKKKPMKTINIKQLLFLIIVLFLFFGDFFLLKKKFKNFLHYFNNFIFKKSRKKGLEPLTFGFGNQSSSN